MEIIVDTSVWIDFFHGRLEQGQKEILTRLLENEQAIITDIIKHELLVGTNSKSEYRILNENLSALTEISIDKSHYAEFNHFGFELRKIGLLGKYTDASIAFLSKKYGYPVLSFDKYFMKLVERHIIPSSNEI